MLFYCWPQLTAFNDFGFVAGLLAQVSGKTEKAKKLLPDTLTSWARKERPWSCPIRHALMTIQIVGHVTGCFS